MRTHQKFNAGFTLIETILYFGLVSVLLISITSLFVTLLESKIAASTLSRVERDSQFIQSRLAHDIRRAELILEPATAGETTSHIRLRIDGDEVLYQVVNDQLTYSQGATVAATQTQTTIQNFTVQRVGAVGGTPTLSIQFDIRSIGQTARGQQNRTYQTTIGIR